MQNTILKTILKSRYQMNNDFSDFNDDFVTEWKFIYQSKLRVIKESQKSKDEMFKMDKTLLMMYIEMADIISIGKQKSLSLFTPQLLADFKNALSETVWDSSKIFSFLELKRTELIDQLGEETHNIKLGIFFTKLNEACLLTKHQKESSLCTMAMAFAFKSDKFKSFVQYRYNFAIFNLIVDRVYNSIDKFNFGAEDEEAFAIKLARGIEFHLIEFEEELNELKSIDPHFVEAHGELRSMMYLLIAKLAYEDKESRLPQKMFKLIIEWTVPRAEQLVKLVLRNREFNEMLEDLRDFILLKLFEDTDERKRLLGSKSGQLDNSVTENGLQIAEKNEIVVNLKQLMLFYSSFTEPLKRRLANCIAPLGIVDRFMQICKHKYGSQCLRLNPFLLGKPCPDNFDRDEHSVCKARCPENYPPEEKNACKKPRIELLRLTIDPKTKVETLKCPSGFYQNDFLCIPRCPVGWKDHGSACERPQANFSMEALSVIVL